MLKALHHGGQRAFLAVERRFNRAFGDRSDPLYALGAIAHWLLWVVTGTGLYLYIFFKTGVHEAYDSVQALTQTQWWAGGIVRSVHRYASDALVLVMALHLARHFFFDRYRGFRWFSWVSGVVLLGLCCASGINGYMLPWDRTAQFVTVATAEWLDWLPPLSGLLVRNFIAPEAVNDRLFSLLSFMHIGLPLVVLALVWVHTQRVPLARTTPPRPVWIAMALALVVLALAKPVTSGPAADLAAAPTVMPFDWFYLGLYPLMYAWSPGALWALVGAFTVLLVLLPWLPPKRGTHAPHRIMVRPDNRVVPARDADTLLDALLREEIPIAYECRSGGCGECKCAVLYGEVEQGPHQASALAASERAAGMVLACTASARGDIEIEYVPRVARVPARLYSARVTGLERLAEDVMRVTLAVEGSERPEFRAGQYLNILLPDGTHRSFSFANAPHVPGDIELHIRRIPGGSFTTHVFEGMKVGDVVRFEAPLGSFVLRDHPAKPVIFVAGATGFAPVKSMIEHAFHTGVQRPIHLYWGVRTRRDLYLASLAEQWAREHANFHFVPVLSEAPADDNWTGRTGLVHEAILADFPDLAGHEVYACGSVKMVEAIHPAFAARGLSDDDCFSDAFRLRPHLARQLEAADMVRLGGS